MKVVNLTQVKFLTLNWYFIKSWRLNFELDSYSFKQKCTRIADLALLNYQLFQTLNENSNI